MTDWSSEVEVLAALLAEHYLHADVAARVSALLRRRVAGGAYRNLATDDAFAATVSEDTTAASGDLHLRLRYSPAPIPGRVGAVVPESGRRPEQAAAEGHGFAGVERLAGNVGLVDLRRLFPVSMSRHAAIAAMHLVAHTDALLIDLRRCSGGEPDMVALVCSYLFDEPVQLSALHFPARDETVEYRTDPSVPGPAFGAAKPVYVLIGPETISAGEGLAYDLQQRGRAVLVGERTAGAANFDYRYRVSDHLMFSVPSGYPVNPVSGGNWEGAGVVPDVAVPAEEAPGTAYSRALEHVVGLGGAGYRRPVHDEAVRALAARREPGPAGRG